jgi:hypothetical protein
MMLSLRRQDAGYCDLEGCAPIHIICMRVQKGGRRNATANMSESSDSTRPAFWNQRYASQETPWTLHAVPVALRSFVKRRQSRGMVLIPGGGTNYEVFQFFQTAGFEVTAIDFSTVAVAQTRKALGNFDGRIISGDFANSISKIVLIWSMNGLFCAHSIHRNGRNMPSVSRSCYSREEGWPASFFTDRRPIRRLIH